MTYVLTFIAGGLFGMMLTALCVAARDDREEGKNE